MPLCLFRYKKIPEELGYQVYICYYLWCALSSKLKFIQAIKISPWLLCQHLVLGFILLQFKIKGLQCCQLGNFSGSSFRCPSFFSILEYNNWTDIWPLSIHSKIIQQWLLTKVQNQSLKRQLNAERTQSQYYNAFRPTLVNSWVSKQKGTVKGHLVS